MKVNRREVYDKCNGHCGYCGRTLEFKRMQVDHLHPRFLSHFYPDLDENRIENLLPTCAKCNNHKSAYRLEEWRKELSFQVSMLRKSAQFDRALRFGQVEVKETPIVFYFETTGNIHNADSEKKGV